jgi:hypothetical protein
VLVATDTWQYNTTVGSQNTLGWIRLACDRDRWRHLWTIQWTIGFHKKQRISWSAERATRFSLSRRTLLHGVSHKRWCSASPCLKWNTRLALTEHVRSVIVAQWRAQNVPSIEYNSVHKILDYSLNLAVPVWCADIPYLGWSSVSMFLMWKPKSCKNCLVRLSSRK